MELDHCQMPPFYWMGLSPASANLAEKVPGPFPGCRGAGWGEAVPASRVEWVWSEPIPCRRQGRGSRRGRGRMRLAGTAAPHLCFAPSEDWKLEAQTHALPHSRSHALPWFTQREVLKRVEKAGKRWKRRDLCRRDSRGRRDARMGCRLANKMGGWDAASPTAMSAWTPLSWRTPKRCEGTSPTV